MSARSETIRPPSGKSGPFIPFAISWATVASGLSTRYRALLTTSRRLCGGTLVAIPTAMPVAPFTSKCGNAAGKTTGSVRSAS